MSAFTSANGYSDQDLAKLLRDAVATANAYADGLRARGFDLKLYALYGDNGNVEFQVSSITKTAEIEL